jgi:hypothetical protein
MGKLERGYVMGALSNRTASEAASLAVILPG